MASEWTEKRLGEFVRLQRGHDLTALEQKPGRVPIMGSAGPNGFHDTATNPGPGVVIGRSGASAGRVHYCLVDFWAHNTTLSVTDFLGNNPKFAFYYLGTLDLASFNSGSAQPSLNRNYIYDIKLHVPPRWDQDQIVTTLSAFDDKIALLRETNATLEAIAQVLFKSWFVDFDPVRAKADGRDPEGVPPEVAELFPSVFENSELGRIPLGWRAQCLDQACEINPTRRIGKGTETPYLEMSAVPTKGHRPELPVIRSFSSGTKFVNGDTLLARITPCLENGKSAFVDFLMEGEVGWGSTEFIVLRPRNPLPDYWGYLLCRHEPFRQFAIQAMVGTSGRQRVEVSRLAQYPVAIPTIGIATAFGHIVEPLRVKIASNDDEVKTLSGLRDTLLPRLMSGKLRIPDAQETTA